MPTSHRFTVQQGGSSTAAVFFSVEVEAMGVVFSLCCGVLSLVECTGVIVVVVVVFFEGNWDRLGWVELRKDLFSKPTLDVPLEVSKRIGSVGYDPNIPCL